MTVGAYMGGYHWSDDGGPAGLDLCVRGVRGVRPGRQPPLLSGLPPGQPAVRGPPEVGPGWSFTAIPTAFVALIWTAMWQSGPVSATPPDPRGRRSGGGLMLWRVKALAIGYIGLSVAVFLLCLLCLIASYRAAANRAERNQAMWILLASMLGIAPIAYLLWGAWWEPWRLGLNSAAWPMYVVSLLYTVAYALSISRYKLMQVEEIYNRSKTYFLASLAAGLIYPAAVVATSLLIGDQLLAKHTSRGAAVAAVAGGVGPGPDRGDPQPIPEGGRPPVLSRKIQVRPGDAEDEPGRRPARRPLDAGPAAAGGGGGDPQGRVGRHLPRRRGPPRSAARRLARARARGACPWPSTTRWSTGSATSPTVRARHALALGHSADPAADTMIALGGEVARALEADGVLVGLMVLGPKRTGLPYEDEEVAFLGALGLGGDAGVALGRHPADPGAAQLWSSATRSTRSPSSAAAS